MATEIAKGIKRRFPPFDVLFHDGNEEREVHAKVWTFDSFTIHASVTGHSMFICRIHGCSASFSNVTDYDSHYQIQHTFVCAVRSCGAAFPVTKYLELHILENHDSYFRLLRKRQPMYECLVHGCNHKSNNRDERSKHLTLCHQFPSHFRFDMRKRGKRGMKEMKNQRQKSQSQSVLPIQQPKTDSTDKAMIDEGIPEEKKVVNSVLSLQGMRSHSKRQPFVVAQSSNSSTCKQSRTSGAVCLVPRQVKLGRTNDVQRQAEKEAVATMLTPQTKKSQTLIHETDTNMDTIDDIVAQTNRINLAGVPQRVSFGGRR